MVQELYRGTTVHGPVLVNRLGERYELVLESGGRVDRRRYDENAIKDQLKRFDIPETVLQSGR
jgi:hypothetical protein